MHGKSGDSFGDPATIELLQFDSTDLPEAEGFARYRELYSRGADAIQLGPDFRARISATRLFSMMVFDRVLRDVGHVRDEARVRLDGFGHFALTYVVDGRFEVSTGDGFRPVEPGHAILLDMTQPMENRAPDAHIVTISLNRGRMRGLRRSLGEDHGRRIGSGETVLLADFARSLLARSGAIGSSLAGVAANTLHGLVEGALRAAEGLQGDFVTTRRHLQLSLVGQIVEANLHDSAFDVQSMAQASGLSRASLYRLLAELGGPSIYLRRRRLERLRNRLADPGEDRPLASLAAQHGFESASHCSRVFLEEYGSRPGDYRERVRRAEEERRPEEKLHRWTREIFAPKPDR
ncbi:helix-turn-helix domain-containing protein [Altererythrobacter aquiaggeris]|uniref:helix-turn-helix domain-containing protein n=1 Tax=Aestuarierythrobacter aquiaggeris TaxID=1898396 RepID=UPI0030191155